MNRTWGICVISVALAMMVNGCSGPKADAGGMNHGRLAGCPDRPNCVSSEVQDAHHRVEPLQLKGDAMVGWAAVREVVGALPRCTIVEATDRYLHATCKSRLFRFTDDLELGLDPATGIIAIRSAARIGYSDLGVNRRRVEGLRRTLKDNGLIH